MNGFIIVPIGGILILGTITWCERNRRKKKFSYRKILTVNEWHDLFIIHNINDNYDITERICKAIAKDVGIHFTQLYPNDAIYDLMYHNWWGFGKIADELGNLDDEISLILSDKTSDINGFVINPITIIGLIKWITEVR